MTNTCTTLTGLATRYKVKYQNSIFEMFNLTPGEADPDQHGEGTCGETHLQLLLPLQSQEVEGKEGRTAILVVGEDL